MAKVKAKRIFDEELKAKILDRVAQGDAVASLSREFKVNPGNIYHWIKIERERSGGDKFDNLRKLPVARSIKERMQELTNDYQDKMRALIIQELTGNLKNL